MEMQGCDLGHRELGRCAPCQHRELKLGQVSQGRNASLNLCDCIGYSAGILPAALSEIIFAAAATAQNLRAKLD
jgi:hypothetical protein